MEELHKTSIGCHGNLKSTNVLVDSYWICKVADYGLQTFRESNLHRKEALHTLSGYWLASFASVSISSFIYLVSYLNLLSCFSAGENQDKIQSPTEEPEKFWAGDYIHIFLKKWMVSN